MSTEIPQIGQTSTRRIKSQHVIFIVSAVIALIGLGIGGYSYYQYTYIKSPAAMQKTAQEETSKLVAEISKLIVLPTDETPTLATVTDINKLKDQQFFKDAKNGDKVLLYIKAQKVIIYDQKAKRIVNVGPINIASQSNQTLQSKIALRNGTEVAGTAAKAETEIQKTFPGSNIISKEQASKTNYDKTIVVALNPAAKEAADKLANLFNVTAANSLPDGEAKPEGIDILVILGKDWAGVPVATQAPSSSPTPK